MFLDFLIVILVVHIILWIINPEFFFWIILGIYVALGCAFYDMYLSTKGEDKVSQIKRGL